MNIKYNYEKVTRGVPVLSVFRNEGAIIRKLIGYQFASAIVGSMLSTASRPPTLPKLLHP